MSVRRRMVMSQMIERYFKIATHSHIVRICFSKLLMFQFEKSTLPPLKNIYIFKRFM